jgi:hypothetical protein
MENSTENPNEWRMIVIDCETRTQRMTEHRFSARESRMAMQEWQQQCKDVNAIAIFWPEWAPPIKVSFCEPI